MGSPPRRVPDGLEISTGYGAALIARFVAEERAKGVIVVGGLPSDFATATLAPGTIRAVAAVYTSHGGLFVALPNDSLYPVRDFFNGEDHLTRQCQYRHSIAVAYRLAAMLGRQVRPPGASASALAATCPGPSTLPYAISAAR